MNIYYFIVLLFVLYSSKANFLFESNIAWFGLEFLLLIVAIYLKKLRKKDIQLLGIATISYFIYITLRFKLNTLSSDYYISDTFYFFKYIVTSYLFCVILREKALYYLVKVIAHLAMISLFFYLIQLVQNGVIVKAIGNTFESLTVNDNSYRYTNFLIFTYDDLHYFRNSGFCWEPGAFGSFLTIALLFSFITNEFKLSFESVVIAIAILTTLSTTAYLGMFILFFLRYRFLSKGNNITLALLVILFAIAIPNIPFLGKKIVEIYEQDISDLQKLEQLSTYYEDEERQIPLNRFASALFLYDQFGWKLGLGVSNQYNEYYEKEYNVNISNGIMDFTTKFGLAGLFFLFYRFGTLCKSYLKKPELVFYATIALMALCFGEPILMLPICLIFLFLPSFKLQDFSKMSYDYRMGYSKM